MTTGFGRTSGPSMVVIPRPRCSRAAAAFVCPRAPAAVTPHPQTSTRESGSTPRERTRTFRASSVFSEDARGGCARRWTQRGGGARCEKCDRRWKPMLRWPDKEGWLIDPRAAQGPHWRPRDGARRLERLRLHRVPPTPSCVRRVVAAGTSSRPLGRPAAPPPPPRWRRPHLPGSPPTPSSSTTSPCASGRPELRRHQDRLRQGGVRRAGARRAKGEALLVDGYAPFCKHVCSATSSRGPRLRLEITPDNEHLLRSGYSARSDAELPGVDAVVPAGEDRRSGRHVARRHPLLARAARVGTSCSAAESGSPAAAGRAVGNHLGQGPDRGLRG